MTVRQCSNAALDSYKALFKHYIYIPQIHIHMWFINWLRLIEDTVEREYVSKNDTTSIHAYRIEKINHLCMWWIKIAISKSVSQFILKWFINYYFYDIHKFLYVMWMKIFQMCVFFLNIFLFCIIQSNYCILMMVSSL